MVCNAVRIDTGSRRQRRQTTPLRNGGWDRASSSWWTTASVSCQRERAIKAFRSGELKVLVATDVASRGIHVEDISHVINYDLPQDSENYIHRIGRTARAGKTGKAFALACEDYVYHLEPLEEMLGYKIPVVWPENDWFVADTSKPSKKDKGKVPKLK